MVSIVYGGRRRARVIFYRKFGFGQGAGGIGGGSIGPTENIQRLSFVNGGDLTHFICATCGVQYPDSEGPPEVCIICADERQYIGFGGQQWTTLEVLRAERRNVVYELEPGLTAIESEPKFAIGQRAILAQAPGGNIFWDCISLIDDQTVSHVQSMGGAAAIAISHPHYYSSMIEWSAALEAPIYIHADDRDWVVRMTPAVRLWEGDTLTLDAGATLIRCGGHFDGGQVMHWEHSADGEGVLLAGDIIQVTPDTRWVSFMYSYPNLIPLSPKRVNAIVEAVAPYSFDRIYSPWRHREVLSDAKGAVARSRDRYIAALAKSGDKPLPSGMGKDSPRHAGDAGEPVNH